MNSAILPKKGSFRDQICQAIASAGPLRISEIVSRFNKREYGTVVAAIHQLKFYQVLAPINGVYGLTNKARIHYGLDPVDEMNPVPVAVPVAAFRPLRKEYMLAHCMNADRFRTDATFLTAGVALPSGMVV